MMELYNLSDDFNIIYYNFNNLSLIRMGKTFRDFPSVKLS